MENRWLIRPFRARILTFKQNKRRNDENMLITRKTRNWNRYKNKFQAFLQSIACFPFETLCWCCRRDANILCHCERSFFVHLFASSGKCEIFRNEKCKFEQFVKEMEIENEICKKNWMQGHSMMGDQGRWRENHFIYFLVRARSGR